MILKDALNRSS